ncbi:RING finger protein 10-like [Oppia nitens]|uniref:RING finger protein 10-like n=1 Tax=Oppia nitens TaxID=1686743 RepID=UPI0023DBFCE5|nr:RING finger protein 10-like [Oppia nitens]
MDRTLVSQQQFQTQSSTDQTVGRQNNRSNRRRNDGSNKNSAKYANCNQYKQNVGQAMARQTSNGRNQRSRASGGSGSVATNVDCDLWSDHLSVGSSDQMNDKLDNKKVFGSKKHNLNHLLNFTYESRDQTFGDHRDYRYQRRSHQRYYNKEHFLQANCQFVVNNLNDYSIHCFDPDIAVDWNAVEEIRFNSLTAETYCPICLDTPVAPKMTRCGHIYCWSCLLHYLALSDHKWRKCPICFDSIQADDLRTVSSVSKADYKIADYITLSLMKRKKGSTIASPAVLYNVNENCINQKFEQLNGNPVISSYQKILVASPAQVLNEIIERERRQLLAQMEADKDTPEVCFIENALSELKKREEILQERCDVNSSQDINANIKETKANSTSNDEFYYFYQSEDGQHIYLHSLNVRILKHEFGSLENCPHNISAKIVETEWETMTDELRKRHRYLQNLPLTCEFRIVELEFTNELISDTTLELFNNEIIRRQKNRAKRAREERRRERHIQVEQNKRIHGIYPLPKYQLNNMQQFPNCFKPSDSLRSPSPMLSSESSAIDDNVSHNNLDVDNQSANYGTSPQTEMEFPSFATMLRNGKAKPIMLSNNNNNNNNTTNSNTNELAANESDSEYRPTTYNYTLSDAFAAALELKSKSSTNDENSGNKKVSKKKKNKPKLLLSTGMNRKY